MVVLRQLLAWERDYSEAESGEHPGRPADTGLFEDRIYVFTPQAAIVELAAGATPIDFAYALHTDLGHRCRSAKVDGALVPLNTPLRSGQVVEITAAKAGGPSMDWLNSELGYLQSQRSKAKVRAWFNALALQSTISRGREAVEKLLQREGKTAIKLDELAGRLGFKNADALFEVVGKDEYSLRNVETLLRPTDISPVADDRISLKRARPTSGSGSGVLVVGVDSLLTVLARCCRPVRPGTTRRHDVRCCRPAQKIPSHAVAQNGPLVQLRRDTCCASGVQLRIGAPVSAGVFVMHGVVPRFEHQPVHPTTDEVARVIIG